ncbi:MAG TPA: T9SS type A sorting domain-containing protein [Candidatus Kryptonia bacterium]
MKPFFPVLFICATLLAFENVFAQTGSDYYLPLRIGNYLKFHADEGPLGWAARTTTHTIEGTDSISGKVYFREKDSEEADNGIFSDVFNVLWLSEDSARNILVAAVGEESSDIDSATILPSPGPFFPTQGLVPGYSIRYPYSNYFMVDSTISDTATVGTPAGTFTNCVMQSETHYDSLGKVVFLEYHYYAHGVGMVLNQRVKPDSNAHTDYLIQYSAVTAVHEKNAADDPRSFSLLQNYPNPFNPSTTISYRVEMRSQVSLKVYNVLGEEVATLVNETKDPGEYSVKMDASRFSSGVYFYRLFSGNYVSTKKMLMTK